MANAMTQITVPQILKELYDGQKVQWLTYKDNPALAMLKKIEQFPGKYYPVPVVYGLSQGASATFTSAFANQSSPKVAEFLVTRVADFSIATIDGQLLASAQTDPGAFIDGAELMIDAAFQTAVNRIASAIFRNGAGTIGQIASIAPSVSFTGTVTNLSTTVTLVSSFLGLTVGMVVIGTGIPAGTTIVSLNIPGNTLVLSAAATATNVLVPIAAGQVYDITLTNPDDAVQFEVGQVLLAVQNVDGSGTTVSQANHATVMAVDRNAGVLRVAFLSALTNWTVAYYLAVEGDLPTTANQNFQPIGSTTTNSMLKIAGFAAWLPIAAPLAGDSFFGVDRSIDNQRLSGVSFDGSALSLEEALLQGTGRIAMNGGRVETGVCSYATYTALIVSLGSKVQYIDEKIGEIGFRGVQVNGANTVMSVFPDRSCPDGLIYCLEMDSWVLRSQGEAPHILKYMDEIEILRVPGLDQAELRVGGYMNLYTNKPGHNGVIQVQLQEF